MKSPILISEIQLWTLERILPFSQNPRVHPEWQVDQIATSMQEFGVVNPVLVDSHGNLIAGHGRFLAGQKLGLTRLPVVVAAHLTPAQVRALRIADNQIAGNSGWDQERLSAEIAALMEQEVDLSLLGFSELELRDLLAELDPDAGLVDDDEIPSTPVQPITQIGDLWVLGEHRVWCGDATLLAGVQELLEGRQAPLVFADPPYNVHYRGAGSQNSRPILNDDLDDHFGQFLFAACEVILKVAAGPVYVCMSSSELHTLYGAFTRAGGHWSTFLIWAKDHFTLGRSDYQRQYEPILYGWKEGNSHYWCGARDVGDVWYVGKPRANTLHPTSKPVELVERAVLYSSQKGDLVLDPFGGSGTTLIACQKTGRCARMVELDPCYVDVMITRWQNYTGKTARLASTGQSYDDRAQEVQHQ
jgi:DNA modification methylase